MDRSVLLAKLIGPPFLAVGLGLLLNQTTYWEMTDEVIRHPSPVSNMLIYLSGVLSMVVGLAVVNAHPSWTRDWRVVITVIGWLLLVGGIMRIVLPDIVLKLGSTFYGSPTALLIVAIISLVLGGFLSFKGYWTKT
jgi:uncharacterized membrane protein HdeD (DUF308 family)